MILKRCGQKIYQKKSVNMKKYFLNFLIISLFLSTNAYPNTKSDKLYEKIDLFGEVLEKIKQEYVDDIDQADVMDSAINGVLQSLDPYSAYMSPELFKKYANRVLKVSLEV